MRPSSNQLYGSSKLIFCMFESLNDLGLPLALQGEISNRKKMNQYFKDH